MDEFRECPYCGGLAFCETVHIGVGLQQCGPFCCEWCMSQQMGPSEDMTTASEEEKKMGWWKHPDIPENLDPREERLRALREGFVYENRSRLERIE